MIGVCVKTNYLNIKEQIVNIGRTNLGGIGYSRLVFTNGVFDCLHPGHLLSLKHAKSLAGPHGAVVVGVNSDDSVRRLKGPNRPVMNEVARCEILVSLKFVDHVVIFSEDTPLELLQCLKPDIIVKGSDYKDKVIVGSEFSVVSISPFDPNFSTTKIIEKMNKK